MEGSVSRLMGWGEEGEGKEMGNECVLCVRGNGGAQHTHDKTH